MLKDEDHPDSPKMVKKGWVIGIVLTVISFVWLPAMLISMMVFDVDQMGDHMGLIPDEMKQMVTKSTQQQTLEPIQQQVPAPGFENVPEMIVESENNCDHHILMCVFPLGRQT